VPGVQPPIDGSEATNELLRERFKTERAPLRAATDEEDAWLADLREVRKTKKVFEDRETFLKNQLINAIGESAGLQGKQGRVTFKAPNGSVVAWKAVAEKLGATPELVRQHSTPMVRRLLPTFPKEG